MFGHQTVAIRILAALETSATVSWISETRTDTKGLNSRGGVFSQDKMVWDSCQKVLSYSLKLVPFSTCRKSLRVPGTQDMKSWNSFFLSMERQRAWQSQGHIDDFRRVASSERNWLPHIPVLLHLQSHVLGVGLLLLLALTSDLIWRWAVGLLLLHSPSTFVGLLQGGYHPNHTR